MVDHMGRKAKGDRELLGTRPDTVLARGAREKAAALGMSISDYLASLIADDLNMPERSPVPVQRFDLELAMPAA